MRATLSILLLCVWVTSIGAAPAMPVQFETLVEGAESGILTPTHEVVRTEAAWRALWARHSGEMPGARPRPEVDFSRFMVLAVFAGQWPGTAGIRVIRVVRESSRLVVAVHAVRAGTRRPFGSAPFHIIRIPASRLPVVFAIETARQEPIEPPFELDTR